MITEYERINIQQDDKKRLQLDQERKRKYQEEKSQRPVIQPGTQSRRKLF